MQNNIGITKAKINKTDDWIASRCTLTTIPSGAKRKIKFEEDSVNQSLQDSVLMENFDCTDPIAILNNKS